MKTAPTVNCQIHGQNVGAVQDGNDPITFLPGYKCAACQREREREKVKFEAKEWENLPPGF